MTIYYNTILAVDRQMDKQALHSDLMLLVGWQEGHLACKKTWWDASMVMCLGQGADLHMAQLKPLPLTISCSSKSRLVLPFWCQLTWVVPDKIQDGCKMVACASALARACMCVCMHMSCSNKNDVIIP